jgi:integrase
MAAEKRPAVRGIADLPVSDGDALDASGVPIVARRAFTRAIKAAGLEHGRPYDLRHSFASLLLHEGRSVIYVARQLGHDARLTLSTYGHVMDEFEDMPRLDAQTAIADARAALAAAASSS